MTIADIIILILVIVLLGLIIYFSIIRPKIKNKNACCKCPYSKQCEKSTIEKCDKATNKTNCEKNFKEK